MPAWPTVMNPAVKGKTDFEGAPYSMVATYAGLLVLGGSGLVVLLSMARGGLCALLTLTLWRPMWSCDWAQHRV